MRGMTSLIAVEKAIYSASVEDSEIVDCCVLFHRIGQFAYRMTKPVRERAVFGSSIASSLFQLSQKLASTKQSNDCSFG